MACPLETLIGRNHHDRVNHLPLNRFLFLPWFFGTKDQYFSQ
jgi:hypothetical protein